MEPGPAEFWSRSTEVYQNPRFQPPPAVLKTRCLVPLSLLVDPVPKSLTFGPISGAHLNPAVTLADAIEHGIPWSEAVVYMLVQCAGGVAGAIIAHLMFGLHWYSFSSHSRHGWALVLSEFVATFGLLSVIWGCSRLRSGTVPFAVASYITAAYWFTASTSFANPAVTIARSISDTFAGIRPSDVPLFIVAQIAGALSATLLFRWLVPNLGAYADQVVVPHSSALDSV